MIVPRPGSVGLFLRVLIPVLEREEVSYGKRTRNNILMPYHNLYVLLSYSFLYFVQLEIELVQ